jgi:hypothetical protein
MIVVSNTSPIMNLAAIGRLDLLLSMFGSLSIPPAVQAEFQAAFTDLPSAVERKIPSWVRVEPPPRPDIVVPLLSNLHPGEAESIALALGLRADLLLVDEKRARQIAREMGLRVLGLLGLLLAAKRRGILSGVRPVLDDLVGRAGFWVGAELYAKVLTEAGE